MCQKKGKKKERKKGREQHSMKQMIKQLIIYIYRYMKIECISKTFWTKDLAEYPPQGTEKD